MPLFAPPPPQLIRTSGNWVFPDQLPPGQIAGGSAITNGTIKLLPFLITQPITVSAFGARVTTAAASGNFQLAVYAVDTLGRATGLPVASTGNGSTTSATTIGVNLGANVTLYPAWWFGAVAVDTNGTSAAFQTVSATAISPLASLVGSPTLGNISAGNTNDAFAYSIAGQTYNTWPDLTGVSPSEITTTASAILQLKVA